MTDDEWNTYFSSHWIFPGTRQSEHIAVFPEELPERLIKMFSFVGDTVCDPFMGSGTTALAAMNLNRNSIGYEINCYFRRYFHEKLTKANGENRFEFYELYKKMIETGICYLRAGDSKGTLLVIHGFERLNYVPKSAKPSGI